MNDGQEVHKADTFGPALNNLRSAKGKILSPTARVWRLISLERGDLSVVLTYAAATGLLSLAVPITVQSLVNTVSFTALSQPLLVLSLLVLVALGLTGVLNTLQYQVVETLNQRFFVRATGESIRRLVHADVTRTDAHAAPELINRFMDVAIVQKACSTLLLDGLTIALQAGVALLLLAFYHPALLAFNGLLIAFIAIILFGLGRKGTATSIKESKAKYAVLAALQEVARSTSLFKSPSGKAFALQRAEDLTRDYVGARKSHFRVLRRQVAASFGLQALATAGLLGLGGKLVIDGQLTLGQLVAAELAVTAVLTSVSKLGKYLENFYDLTAALDKVGQIIDLPSERSVGAVRHSREGAASLRLDRITYSHNGGVLAVGPLSLTIAPGQVVAALGKDASGKTTLAEILYGLRNPDSGSLLLDGASLTGLALSDIRSDVSLVSGDPPFSGTLLENLELRRASVDPARVSSVLSLVGLTQDVNSLPHGAMTPIGPGGTHLTSSQSARLSLARAILSAPRLLVLDGVLDRIEQSAALQILAELRQLTSSTSILVLTSDPIIASATDHLVRLDGGQHEVTTE